VNIEAITPPAIPAAEVIATRAPADVPSPRLEAEGFGVTVEW
jgi:hypothetical protein